MEYIETKSGSGQSGSLRATHRRRTAMTEKERRTMQRAMVRRAIGELRAAIELFGAEDQWNGQPTGFPEFETKVDEFERWVFEESGLA